MSKRAINIIIIALALIAIAYGYKDEITQKYNDYRNRKLVDQSMISDSYKMPEPKQTTRESLEITDRQMREVIDVEEIPDLKRVFSIESMIEKTKNEDIVGILEIPGTEIRYPVVQTTDNEYYVDNNVFKEPDIGGAIFLDFENDLTKDDPNTVIYGHNMNSRLMFHELRYWKDKDYFDSHRIIKFSTIDGEYEWEVFAFYKTDIEFNYIQVYFQDAEEFNALAKEMQSKSMHPTDVELKEGDRIITLSTCTNQEAETRYVLNARLIKEEGQE